MGDDYIFLIEKFWFDHQAYGYKLLGYVKSQAEAIHICTNGELFDKRHCQLLEQITPEFRMNQVQMLNVVLPSINDLRVLL
jgi:hypothetical protein